MKVLTWTWNAIRVIIWKQDAVDIDPPLCIRHILIGFLPAAELPPLSFCETVMQDIIVSLGASLAVSDVRAYHVFGLENLTAPRTLGRKGVPPIQMVPVVVLVVPGCLHGSGVRPITSRDGFRSSLALDMLLPDCIS